MYWFPLYLRCRVSCLNRLLPNSFRYTFEGDAARIMLSPNQVTKLEATLLCKLELDNSL
jgi:hypothetical protein